MSKFDWKSSNSPLTIQDLDRMQERRENQWLTTFTMEYENISPSASVIDVPFLIHKSFPRLINSPSYAVFVGTEWDAEKEILDEAGDRLEAMAERVNR